VEYPLFNYKQNFPQVNPDGYKPVLKNEFQILLFFRKDAAPDNKIL